MTQENTRQNILETSLSLFSQKGYDNVGMAEICTACNVTKPTVYYYFQSKLGLLEAVLNEYGAIMIEKIQNASDYERDFIKHLTDLLKTNIQFAKDYPDFFKLYNALNFTAVENESYKAHLSLQKKIDAIYLTLFEKSVDVFGNMKGYEQLFSKIFQSTVISSTNAVLNNELDPSEDTIYRIIRSFVYGVAN